MLALSLFGLMELVVMWFPRETVAGIFDEEPSFIALHGTHFMAVGVVAWAVVLSILVQLHRLERRVAPMLLAVGAALG